MKSIHKNTQAEIFKKLVFDIYFIGLLKTFQLSNNSSVLKDEKGFKNVN